MRNPNVEHMSKGIDMKKRNPAAHQRKRSNCTKFKLELFSQG
jgi:hypothetical protein